jgi:pyruvate dehydrogenase E2 component (dihydrolipoamide acetyltransferase)
MTELKMPSLGADMDAGTLLEWRVKPGDRVDRGDIVAVVDTQKAAMEIESYGTGIVTELLVAEGEKVPVGTVLATLRDVDETEPPPTSTAEPAQPTVEPEAATGEPKRPAAEPKPAPAAPPARPRTAPAPRLRISPAARLRARELGVDPATVTGSGRSGAITLRDIEAAAGRAAPEPHPARTTSDRAPAIRQAIAATMTRANREIPHYYLATTIDMARATAHLASVNASRPPAERLLPAALLLRAVVVGLTRVPELNGHWVDGELQVSSAIHLATAVSLRGGGVITPAIRDADQLTVDQLMARLRDLVARARAGRLRSSEMTDATVTVTSLGDRGPEAVFGVIYPPQVALVGFGSIVDRPWAIDGALAVHPVVTATLAGDHRASDGLRGGKLLSAIDRALQDPEEL